MAASISPKTNPAITWTRTETSTLDLHGKNVAVVGGTGGLGRALSRILASRGARVSVIGQTFREAGTPGIDFVKADLSSMTEAARVADELPAETLDLLVLTTGIFAAPTRQETVEGLERDMAVSYLNRLVIIRRLAHRLGTGRPADAAPARIFIMGFPGTGQDIDLDDLNAEHSYNGTRVHLGTVAGNEALVLDTARRYPNLRVYGLNPGLAKTNIRSNMYGRSKLRAKILEGMIGLFAPTADKYGERIAPLLIATDITAHTGISFGSKGQAIYASPEMTDSRAEAITDAATKLLRAKTPTVEI